MEAKDLLIFALKDHPKSIDGTEFEDADLSKIPSDTICLNLENSPITDAGISNLPQLPALRCIDLDSTAITDKALEILTRFANLEEIWLEQTAITDRGLASLYHLKKLKYISIEYCNVSDEAVAALRVAVPTLWQD